MTDLVYLYDGSFDGLLCCVFDSYTKKEVLTAIYSDEDFAPSLFATRTVVTDTAHARRVYRSLVRISPTVGPFLRRCHLTCLEEKELYMYRFVRKLYRLGPPLLRSLTDETYLPLLRAVRHLEHEVELLRGFVRFSELSGVLGGEIEPKNRVLPLLRSHFCSRYQNERLFLTTAPTGRPCFTPMGGRKSCPWSTSKWPVPTRPRPAIGRCGSGFMTPSPSGSGRIPACDDPYAQAVLEHHDRIPGSGLFQGPKLSRRCPIPRRSRRDTWTWDTPSTFATCSWVNPL